PDPSNAATFDEYYTLATIGHANLSAAAAAAESRRPEFIKAAESYVRQQEIPKASSSSGNATTFRRRPSLDLRKAVSDRKIRFLLLDRIVSVLGWEVVKQWS